MCTLNKNCKVKYVASVSVIEFHRQLQSKIKLFYSQGKYAI